MNDQSRDEFFIVDIRPEWHRNPYVTFWRPKNSNYAYPLAWAGRYTREQIEEGGSYYALKEGGRWHRFPVRCAEVEALATSMPGAGIVDGDVGPVVPQTAAIVAKLKRLKIIPQSVAASNARKAPHHG